MTSLVLFDLLSTHQKNTCQLALFSHLSFIGSPGFNVTKPLVFGNTGYVSGAIF